MQCKKEESEVMMEDGDGDGSVGWGVGEIPEIMGEVME